MTLEEFQIIAHAQRLEDNFQTWWTWEWGGFRNMLGLAVIRAHNAVA